MKPGEKSKSKTSSTVSRENPHPPQNSNRIQLQYFILHIHIIYGSYLLQYNTIHILKIYTNHPKPYYMLYFCIDSPQSDIYPYSLIYRSPQTPNPTFTFRRFQTPPAPHGRWRRGAQRRCLGDGDSDAQGVGEKT